MSPRAAGGSGLRVGVIGGSLGGLNAALWLTAAGCDVHVYERSPHTLSSRGAGIVVQDDTVRYLTHHGTALEQISTHTSGRVYLQPGAPPGRIPGGQRFTSWNTLYRHLLAALDPSRYHLGAAVTAVTQDANTAQISFADGSTVEVDLLVAADGPRSTVREQLLPGVTPSYAGYVAWRGLAHEHDVPADALGLFDDTFAFAELPHSQALCYPIPGPDGETARGSRLLNWLWYRTITPDALTEVMTDRDGRTRTTSLPPGMVAPAQDEALRADAATLLPPPFATLVATTAELFLQQVVDLSVPRMVFGRVVLIGDAAFVPRPHTAGSTMKAAYNGETLARGLATAGMELPTALSRWEAQQLRIGQQLQEQGQALAASSGLGRR